MLSYYFRQMRGNDRRRINNRVTDTFRTLSLGFRDPQSRQVERRLICRNIRDLLFDKPGIHGHIMIKQYLAFTYLYALDLDYILVRVKLDVIPQTYDRNHGTEFKRNLASDHYDTVKKVTTLADIGQRDDTVSEFEFYRIDLQK